MNGYISLSRSEVIELLGLLDNFSPNQKILIAKILKYCQERKWTDIVQAYLNARNFSNMKVWEVVKLTYKRCHVCKRKSYCLIVRDFILKHPKRCPAYIFILRWWWWEVSEDIWSTRCDRCTKWALGCELDGTARRNCIKNNYKFYNKKAEGK